MRGGDLVSVLEAAYAIEEHPDDEGWMQSLVQSIPPLVREAIGTNGFLYDTRVRPVRTWAIARADSPLESEVLASAVETSTEDYLERLKRTPVAMAADVPGFDSQPAVELLFRPRGIEDILTINAYSPLGFGCIVGHPLSARHSLSKAERVTFSRVASHIAAAFRLRLRLQSAAEEPEAVLTPDGKAVDARGGAKLDRSRTALRTAAMQMESARGKMRRSDAAQAVDHWMPLVSARWTLVDHFENDGKRYILARVNEPMPNGSHRLTPRERQVVALAALGHHMKLVAYELGISASTARVLLSRAARKVGAKTRDELIQKIIEDDATTGSKGE
ncbi:MAG: helix-turn-helix transcriptional regulator [Polyangiaceae bacterium]